MIAEPLTMLLDGGTDNWYLYATRPDGRVVREGPLTEGWACLLYRDITGHYPDEAAIRRHPLHGRTLPPDPAAPSQRPRKSWR